MSTRPNYGVEMSMDVIPRIHRQLEVLRRANPEKLSIDLFLHSAGGDITVPWRLMTLIREYTDDIDVIVPHWCFSAATLAALGAEHIVMHRMGMLGPIDPSLPPPYRKPDDGVDGGIQVEDVAGYVKWLREASKKPDIVQENIRLLPQTVHPLALGAVWRTTQQGRMLARKLLAIRKTATTATSSEVIKRLSTELFYHGHPIGREEARLEIGLDFVVEASDELEDGIWALYSAYSDEMRLHDPFIAVQEALKLGPLAPPTPVPPPTPTPPSTVTRMLPIMRDVFLESEALSLYHEAQLEVTLLRDVSGQLMWTYIITLDGWAEEN
jgi:hypothetical protein